MNIKITHKWLLEYLDTKATPSEIQKYLSLCGPSIEHVEETKDGDVVYDIEITSNRVDTASVIGIAREAATILTRFGIPSVFKKRNYPSFDGVSSALPLEVEDKHALCRRILAIVLDSVKIGPSPSFISSRLEAAGIRSLNNVVDVTNYVMTELGHPTHVFDYDRILSHKLIIRNAHKNEEIVTLDNKKYALSSEDIIIDDGEGRVIDLPGIMGTANSVVTNDTKRIIFFLEANNPVAIRQSSMRYGIRTVAATINEKSPDPTLGLDALKRGVELFKEIAHARVAGEIIDLFPTKPSPAVIHTTVSFINERIGISIPKQQIVDILTGLCFSVTDTEDRLSIEVPTFRSAEVTIPEDIVEEVARIYGYHNLPNNLPPPAYLKQPKDMEDLFQFQHSIKLFLKHLGLNETLNYSMISEQLIRQLDMNPDKHLHLANVMSEEIKFLRISLIPSLIKNIKLNEAKRQPLSLFEVAKIYMKQDGDLPKEIYKLGIATTKSFFDLKGIIEGLLHELHVANITFSASKNPLFSTGVQVAVYADGDKIGELGMLKSIYKDRLQLSSSVCAAELDFNTLISHARMISAYKPIHPYAVIKLDTTVTLTSMDTYQSFVQHASKVSALLQKIEFVGIYKNKATFRLYFSSPHRNITEEEAKHELALVTRT